MRRTWWVLAVGLAVLAPACGDDGGGEEVEVLSATVEANDTTLNFVLGACNATQKQAEVTESADDVQVTVTVEGIGDDGCADSMTVQLAQPLGDRTLIDTTTDEEIPIEDAP